MFAMMTSMSNIAFISSSPTSCDLHRWEIWPSPHQSPMSLVFWSSNKLFTINSRYAYKLTKSTSTVDDLVDTWLGNHIMGLIVTWWGLAVTWRTATPIFYYKWAFIPKYDFHRCTDPSTPHHHYRRPFFHLIVTDPLFTSPTHRCTGVSLKS